MDNTDMSISIGEMYLTDAPAEPCECVSRLLRAVSDGKAACARHKICAGKVGGQLQASRFPDVVAPIAALNLRQATSARLT